MRRNKKHQNRDKLIKKRNREKNLNKFNLSGDFFDKCV